jgi:hypothetical protein
MRRIYKAKKSTSLDHGNSWLGRSIFCFNVHRATFVIFACMCQLAPPEVWGLNLGATPRLDLLVVSALNPCLSTPPCSSQVDTEQDSLRTMEKHYDIIVVGAGVAGSAAATTFARQGHRVLLLERSLKQSDRIVGELLQPGGVIALEKLGLGTVVEGIDAIPVRGYHIYWKDEEVTFYYPSLDHGHASSSDTKGNARPEGRSFHHGRFVSRLRELAKKEARVTVVEGTATSLVTDKQTERVIGVECMTSEKHSGKVSYPNTTCNLSADHVAVLL